MKVYGVEIIETDIALAFGKLERKFTASDFTKEIESLGYDHLIAYRGSDRSLQRLRNTGKISFDFNEKKWTKQ